jgi:hypothetical protein
LSEAPGRATIALRSRLESSPLRLDEGERLVVINDVRKPIGRELIDRYNIDVEDVYDIYIYVDTHKKALIKGYLDAVDGFYLALRRLVPSHRFSDNILLYHFSSKRTDVYPSFLKYCVVELREKISRRIDPLPLRSDLGFEKAVTGFSFVGRLRLAIVALLFFLKLILIRTALLVRRSPNRIEDSDVVFYTQYPRQSGPGFDNVNYGRVFNELSPDTRCVYLLSALTDGVHDGPGWRELLRRSGAERHHGKHVWLMERAIDFRLILRTAWLLVVYTRVLLALSERRLSGLPVGHIEIFQEELRPTVRRMFNYAYVLELSRSLANTVQDKVFVYYLYEHNYGKLLSFNLHENNVTVGCEHGTMSHLRLGQYLTPQELETTTFPDHIIAEGTNHQEALEWIHPGIDVQVLGAPRVEHLARASASPTRMDGQETTILVPLSLHGDLGILDYVVAASKAGHDVRFYVKPHPAAGKRQRDLVIEYLKDKGLSESEASSTIYDGVLNDLLGRVDYVLFTDTSVGLEFAEAGATALGVVPTDRLDLCPLIDMGLFAPTIPLDSYTLSTPAELLERLSNRVPTEDGRVIPRDFYFAHIGSSTEKWAEFIKSQVDRAKARSEETES